VEELSKSKKGWQKGYSGAKATSLLDDESNSTNLLSVPTSSSSFSMPRTMMELGRDWRRLPGETEKCLFLSNLGRTKFKKIISNGDDFETLESILNTIVTVAETNGSTEIRLQNPSGWIKTFQSMSGYEMFISCIDSNLSFRLNNVLAMPAPPKHGLISISASESDQGLSTEDGGRDEMQSIEKSVIQPTDWSGSQIDFLD
jgi:hypothetical protein